MLCIKQIKGPTLLLIGNIAQQLSSFLVFIVLFRALDKESVSFYIYILEFIAVFATVSDGGLFSYYLKRLVNTNDQQREFFNIKLIQQKITPCVFVCALLVYLFMDSKSFTLISICIFGTIIHAYFSPIYASWYAREKHDKIFIKDIIISLSKLCYFFFGIFVNSSVEYYLLFNGFSAILIFSYIRISSQEKVYIKGRCDSSFGKEMKYFFFLTLVNSLYNKIDVLMIKEIGVFTDISEYSVVYKFIFPLVTFSSVFILGFINRIYNKDSKEHGSLSLLAFIIGIPVAFISFLLIPILVTTFIGTKFIETKAISEIMVLYLPTVFAYGVVSGSILGLGRVKFVFITNFLGLVFNVFLNYLLIPSHGAIAAAFSTVLSENLLLVICLMFLIYTKGKDKRIYLTLVLSILSTIFTVFVFL